jgi:hypothetical protein
MLSLKLLDDVRWEAEAAIGNCQAVQVVCH